MGSSDSTPLLAACFGNQYEEVQNLIRKGEDVNIPNKHGQTGLMYACYKGNMKIVHLLLKAGADINSKDVDGITAIYYCAENGFLAILRLLIERGALVNIETSHGMTPLMIAIVKEKQRIVKYLINCSQLFTKEQKIDALELLGARFITQHSKFTKAQKLWFRALKERNQEPIVPKKIDQNRKKAYDNLLEITNLDELRQIRFDLDKLKMQALIVAERILIPNFKHYYIQVIIPQADLYINHRQYDRAFDLLLHCLQFDLFRLLFNLEELFINYYDSIVLTAQLNATDVLLVIRKCIQWIHIHHNVHLNTNQGQTENTADALSETILYTFKFVVWFNKFLVDVDKCANNDHDQLVSNLYEEITKLMAMNVRLNDNRTILHLFVVDHTFGSCLRPIDEYVNLVLTCGINPNDEDDFGNRPLHYAVKNYHSLKTIDLLLQFGAHYDAANHDGHTYRSIMRRNGHKALVMANKYVTLQCLAAITIKRYQTRFKSRIPYHLEAFINFHSRISFN